MNIKQALDILIAVGICGITSVNITCSDCPLYTDDDEESPIHCMSWTDEDVAEAIKLVKTVKVIEPNPADPEVIVPVDELKEMLDKAPEPLPNETIGLIGEPIFPAYSLHVPKPIATIKVCGAIVFTITDDTEGFIKPTPEQIKNLKETLCIDVELLEGEEK